MTWRRLGTTSVCGEEPSQDARICGDRRTYAWRWDRASTAIFSVMDNILMEPFPYRMRSDSIRYLSMIRSGASLEGGLHSSGPDFWIIWNRSCVLTG